MSQYVSKYYDLQKAVDAVQSNKHRIFIGGLWDEIGRLQFDFLKDRGLRPDMRALDVGCGCLRGGVHLEPSGWVCRIQERLSHRVSP